MLTSRTLKQEPPLDEKTLLSLLEQGPQGRPQMFAHFRATFPNGEPNVDGIRGNYLDQCLTRFIDQEQVGVDKDGTYRLTGDVFINGTLVLAAIEKGVATTIDDLRFHFLAGKGRLREQKLEQTLAELVRTKKLTCVEVKKDGKDEKTREYAVRPAKKTAPTDMSLDAAFLPPQAQMPTLESVPPA